MTHGTSHCAADNIHLCTATEAHLAIFFDQQNDPTALHMAAFTAKDPTAREAFMAHWNRILADPSVAIKTILYDGQVAGSVSRYVEDGRPEVTYWLGREFWGKGIATAALAAFLQQVAERPIYARAAKDNGASLRVLQKCGFAICGEDRGYANARGMEVEEFILRLD